MLIEVKQIGNLDDRGKLSIEEIYYREIILEIGLDLLIYVNGIKQIWKLIYFMKGDMLFGRRM